jgi:hypothetical protein
MPLKKLQEDEIVRLGGQLLVQPLASDADHTALLLTYGQTRILIPGGVDPAFIKTGPANLSSLSVLILNDDDIANLPADMWQNFGAAVTLWNSTALAPDSAWLSLDSHTSITVDSNGQRFKVTSSN